jgi:hypothetical protein
MDTPTLLPVEQCDRDADLRLEWREGPPPKPWSQEWFIALTTYGDRVVLRALPEEYTYDFTTADSTYIKADRIAKWMQFPDSSFIAPEPTRLAAQSSPGREEIEALQKCRDQFAFYMNEHQHKADMLRNLAKRTLGGNQQSERYRDSNAYQEKADTNRKFVQICDAALSANDTQPRDERGL